MTLCIDPFPTEAGRQRRGQEKDPLCQSMPVWVCDCLLWGGMHEHGYRSKYIFILPSSNVAPQNSLQHTLRLLNIKNELLCGHRVHFSVYTCCSWRRVRLKTANSNPVLGGAIRFATRGDSIQPITWGYMEDSSLQPRWLLKQNTSTKKKQVTHSQDTGMIKSSCCDTHIHRHTLNQKPVRTDIHTHTHL